MSRLMIIVSLLAVPSVQAEDCVTVLETAGQGTTNGGLTILDTQFLGVGGWHKPLV